MTKREEGAAVRTGREREKEREKNDREVKRGTGMRQQGYEDGVGRGEEGKRARRRKGRNAVVNLRLRGRKEGEE